MKTSELIGPALDWAVAKCEGYDLFVVDKNAAYSAYYSPTHGALIYALYSTKWEQGGPIIEREGIAIDCLRTCGQIDGWIAATEQLMEDTEDEYSVPIEFRGPTPLIAAMRCYVASKLGDEVNIPKELLGEQ